MSTRRNAQPARAPAPAVVPLRSTGAPGLAPVPLYFQLEQDLRERILRGEFQDRPLPTEEQLCASYGISRITVRRALDGLLAHRLIVRRRGVGTFPAADVGSVQSVRLVGYLDDTLAYTRNLTYRRLSYRRVLAPPMVAAALQVEPQQHVFQLNLLVQQGALPFTYSSFYFPEDVGARIKPAKDVADGIPILRIVERHLGQPIRRGEQVVRAALADEDTSRLLEIAPGTPLLRALRTYYTADDRPVEMALVRYHPDRYDFKVDLVTHPGPAAPAIALGPVPSGAGSPPAPAPSARRKRATTTRRT